MKIFFINPPLKQNMVNSQESQGAHQLDIAECYIIHYG